jgi:hypothetical protein
LPSFTALQPPRGRSHRHNYSIGCAAERPPEQEALMSDAIPQQHPAVVLRSHYMHLRTLLAIAMIAVLGLTVAVMVLANDTDQPTVRSATPATAPVSVETTRFDGGPDEGTRGPGSLGSPTRFDGGPDEGTRGPGH